jgi:hypothetical protein
MKWNVKLSSHPNFSETFICITNVRTISKGLVVYDQKLLALQQEQADNQHGDG